MWLERNAALLLGLYAFLNQKHIVPKYQAMSSLIGLENFCGKKARKGLIKIEYATLADIDTGRWSDIRSVANMHTTDIHFHSGQWHWAYVLPIRKIWRENQKDTKQGTTYDQLIQGIIPDFNPAGSAELDKMAKHQFILRIKDGSGQYWILGSPEYPFRFQSSGTLDSGERVDINFYSTTIRKAAGFQPLL